ncbi:hypothetical protein LCGC14_3075160 [marine sediment metagenome]|uniref:Uncharacterized protein n=1 Tax=marine sediment metagenome TaxID=412755 RepID=A0A0F8WEZ3_9ZZZZ
MKPNIRIHSHPKMEEVKDLDKNHVIIDKELYFELLRRYGSYLFLKEEVRI